MGKRSKKENADNREVKAHSTTTPSLYPPFSTLEAIAAGLISLWLVILHFIYLNQAGPLWRDEAGTIAFATMPTITELWKNLQYDNFPPLFPFLARAWAFVGSNSDFSFRVLGFSIGLATIGTLWLGARSLGARVPLLCLSLYALNPLSIRVGDSMRSYGLGYILQLLTFIFFWKFINAPQRTWFVAATLAAILSVQCLYQNSFFLVAFALGAWAVTLAKNERRTAAGILIIGCLAALSLLLHLSNIIKGQDWFIIAQQTTVTPRQIVDGLLDAMHHGGLFMPWIWLGLAITATVVVIFLKSGRTRAPHHAYCAVILAGSFLLFLCFLLKLKARTPAWYFLILLAPTALAIDVILGSAPSKLISYFRMAAALVLAAITVPLSFSGVQLRQTNIDLVAQTLREKVQPGDMVLVSPWYYGVSLQRYYDSNAFVTLPPMEEIRIHRYDLMKRYMMSENPVGPLFDQIQNTLRNGKTLWVVGFVIIQPNMTAPRHPPYRPGLQINDAAYFSDWLAQMGILLEQTATKAEQIPIPSDDKINPLENLTLHAISGWRGKK